MSKKIIALAILGVLLFSVLGSVSPEGALAAPAIPSVLTGGTAIKTDSDATINAVFGNLAKILVAIAVGVLLISLIIGAIYYITAGGSDRADTGKNYIVNGIIGAVILFALSFILGFVEQIATEVFK